MSKRKPLETTMILVPAIIVGEFVRLLDKDGNPITGLLPATTLTSEFDNELFKPMLWMMAAKRLEVNQHYAIVRLDKRGEKGTWEYKAETLARSFYLRSFTYPKIRKRKVVRMRHEPFRTTDWPEALDRMWHQWNNQRRNKIRSKWERWAVSVDNNHHKKARGRLERQGNCGQNSRHHQTSELPLCDKRPGTDAGDGIAGPQDSAG